MDERTIPAQNPLVRVIHMSASAFDADGVLCGHFEMKAVRHADSVERLHSESSGYTLVELQETTARPRCLSRQTTRVANTSIADAVNAGAMDHAATEEDRILLQNLLGSASIGGNVGGHWM